MSAVSEYPYDSKPISGRQIRVLCFEDKNISKGAKFIVQNVDDVRLSSTFDALSYCWGQEDPTIAPFKVDGKRVDITKNGSCALQHLVRDWFQDQEKMKSAERDPFTIWVDAICVNQKADEEKASQIPLMVDIYTRARRVYIWLGTSSPSVNTALKFLATHAKAKSCPTHSIQSTVGSAGDAKLEQGKQMMLVQCLRPVMP